MKNDNVPDADAFIIPAQTIRGSRQEMLAAIDHAIVGLLALRHVVAGEALTMPGIEETRGASHGRNILPTSLGKVGRLLSDVMRGRD